ncbi:uracil-DNA glycosylase [Pedobacter cryoconitis]|uniref:Uracil-DNA glycosylase n=1 Tax=Pedobacter cryoconitis TaxID=188932 RepID=A0A7W8ZQS0_9SPHI|nr:uracil-DNA glycosylase family protein [Pedobacter cryoconitis]MBB5638457.1 uracil-DNA glycosylase [Pedobacter cryoconitis]MBB6270644.1 uracil-DNA glycosylase [Pedobacter cryoconitis]
MDEILKEIRSCMVCRDYLPNLPKPVVRAGVKSKIVIIGQAPGQKVQNSGIPWDDQSGNELRRWLGVSKEQFYDDQLFALIPMGFCYPGKGISGDLPPRPECAPLWHQSLLSEMKEVKLTILIGQYAQNYYLKDVSKRSLTERVRHFDLYLPLFLPVVHPSPRNKIWQKKNPWFELEVVPFLRGIVSDCIKIS